jgi:phosphatidylglycerophosphate synthase
MTLRSAAKEAWILAGHLDGAPAEPSLLTEIAGLPHVLRIACDLALAGATRIHVVWSGPTAAPELAAIAADPRLAARATLALATHAPAGDDGDAILVARADRIYHRDMPVRAAATWQRTTARLVKVNGEEHDAIVVTERRTARVLATRAPVAGGIAAELARLAVLREIASAELPYLGFTMPAPDRRARARAERRLVWSLRKSADGIAAKLLNRYLSLPMTWLLARTRIHPNHVTLIALACALTGALVIARGGYTAGLAGMLLVELGSIVDGIDGELARLRFQFSRSGQWLDTVVDDVSTVGYAAGVTANLAAAGVTWAVPVCVVAVIAFTITQSTQYLLIKTVYRSGDLAAIPWAFQSSEFLSRQPTGLVAWVRLTAPKLFKRDFVVTLCVVFAAVGHLELILMSFSGGALVFFVVFWVQAVRNRSAIGADYRRSQVTASATARPRAA